MLIVPFGKVGRSARITAGEAIEDPLHRFFSSVLRVVFMGTDFQFHLALLW